MTLKTQRQPDGAGAGTTALLKQAQRIIPAIQATNNRNRNSSGVAFSTGADGRCMQVARGVR